MTNYRKFQISDDLFWGYNETIDINLYTNSNDIICEVKKRLKHFLAENNLHILKEMVDDKTYFLPSFEDILVVSDTKNTIYLCMCSHNH